MTEKDQMNQMERAAEAGGVAAPQLLGGRARQLIRQALSARFAAFLKPGERLDIDAELAADYVWAKITLRTVDDSFQLDVEASVLWADQGDATPWQAERYLEVAIEFLKLQLYEFFRQDREERFHGDWRIYPIEALTLRFRGEVRMPSAERDADQLLGAAPDAARRDPQ